MDDLVKLVKRESHAQHSKLTRCAACRSAVAPAPLTRLLAVAAAGSMSRWLRCCR